MSISVKTLDELDHCSFPGEYLYQIHAHNSFAMGEQHLYLLAFFPRQRGKMANLQ